MNQTYRSALVILSAVMLSGCSAGLIGAMVSGVSASSASVVVSAGAVGAVGAIGAEAAANQPKQPLISEIDIKLNKLETVNTIALLKIPDPPLYGRDTALGENPEEYEVFSFSKTSQEILKKHLEELGFEVVKYPVNRENKTRLVNNYANLDTNVADAYLDVVPAEIEYNLQGPYVSVVVRLVMADTTEVIYAGSVQYGGGIEKPISGIQIESPEDYSYESIEALIKDKEKAFGRLVEGVGVVSLSIAKEIGMAKVNGTIAANEIEAETYDKNLWAKALVETGGDQTKRKTRYIELRAEEFYAANQKPVVVEKINTYDDITGTYVSDITTNSWIFSEPQHRKLVVSFVQDGDSIIGSSRTANLKIEGTRDGDIITFFTWPGGSGTTSTEIKGKWKISPDGSRIEGAWHNTRGSGKWDLTRDDRSIKMISSASRGTAVFSTYRNSLLGEEIKAPKIDGKSNLGSEELGFEYYGQAEEEIDTQTYDKKLWEQALVETGGNQTKRKTRYIELRANQLYSEKYASLSPLEQSEVNSPVVLKFDISGDYVAEITSNRDDFFGNIDGKLVFKLEQNGNRITAVNTTRNLKIGGTRKGNTIDFFVEPHKMNYYRNQNGVWEIDPDGINITGSWKVKNWGVAGQWNLTRIE